MNNQNVVRLAMVSLVSFLLTGCAHKLVKKDQPMNSAAPAVRQEAVPSFDAAREAVITEPDVRGDALRSIPELKTVYFDFDSSFLKPAARAVLVSNAGWLKDHGDIRVQVSGNCDQRGTIEYNLALGQRRAAAVREYYVHMGVAGDRVATISYGKERLACQESTEACWQKNRRGETLEAVQQNVSRR